MSSWPREADSGPSGEVTPKLGFVARITTALMRHLLTRCHEIFSVLMSRLILSVGLIRWGPSLLPLWMKELRLSGEVTFFRSQVLIGISGSRSCFGILAPDHAIELPTTTHQEAGMETTGYKAVVANTRN